MIEFTHERRSGTDLSQLIQYYKTAAQAGLDKRAEVNPASESGEVNISKKAHSPYRISRRLACKDDKFLGEKFRRVKELIAKGEYEFDLQEVAKKILRTEISRHLERSKGQLVRIDRTELLALTEEDIAAGEKIAAQRIGAKETRPGVERHRVFTTNRCKVKPNLLDFLR